MKYLPPEFLRRAKAASVFSIAVCKYEETVSAKTSWLSEVHENNTTQLCSFIKMGKCQLKIIRLCDWTLETKLIIVGDSLLRKPVAVVYCLSMQ